MSQSFLNLWDEKLTVFKIKTLHK